jgi:hypothetical protein
MIDYLTLIVIIMAKSYSIFLTFNQGIPICLGHLRFCSVQLVEISEDHRRSLSIVAPVSKDN